MKVSWGSIQLCMLGLCGAIFAILGEWYSDRTQHCPQPLDPNVNLLVHPECAFSETYLGARTLFRSTAKLAKAEVLETLHVTGLDLTTDLAVFRGDPRSLVLHISGTHGTEGFVGSAIQIAAMRNLRQTIENNRKHENGTNTMFPTVIFVHALNPYGMAHWRRWNEDGIDLNRNAMFSEEQWQQVLNRDPNIAGYEDINTLLNPPEPPSWLGFICNIFKVAIKLLASGNYELGSMVKKSIVTGTYTQTKGIYYGGNKLATSHDLLSNWLRQQGYLESVERLSIIDVHSGLGPQARDTLLVLTDNPYHANSLFVSKNSTYRYANKDPLIETIPLTRKLEEVSGGSILSGYELAKGDVVENYPTLFPNIRMNQSVLLTQEFGTISPILVLASLIQENQAHWYLAKQHRSHTKWSEAMFNAFNVKRASFQQSVVGRGLEVFYQCFDELSTNVVSSPSSPSQSI